MLGSVSIGRIIYTVIVSVIFFVIAYMHWRKRIKEIKRIKPSINDKIVEAKVIKHIPVIRTSDIKPVVEYKDGIIRKQYEFYSLKRPKAYPIGKKCKLKISSKSGKAYIRRDIIKGLMYAYLSMGFPLMGLVLVVIYMIKYIVSMRL